MFREEGEVLKCNFYPQLKKIRNDSDEMRDFAPIQEMYILRISHHRQELRKETDAVMWDHPVPSIPEGAKEALPREGEVPFCLQISPNNLVPLPCPVTSRSPSLSVCHFSAYSFLFCFFIWSAMPSFLATQTLHVPVLGRGFESYTWIPILVLLLTSYVTLDNLHNIFYA